MTGMLPRMCTSGTWSAMKAVVGFLLALLTPIAAVAADPYAFVEGGVVFSPDRSNNDEVEFGDEAGGSLAAGIGQRYSLSDRWRIGVEGQVIGQGIPLHGRNDKRHATADGRYFWLAGLTANAWPEYRLNDRWSLYGGGGAGPSVITAFGSSAPTVLVIGGAGARFEASDDLILDLGGRYYWTAPATVNGAKSTYDSFGPSFRLMWFF